MEIEEKKKRKETIMGHEWHLLHQNLDIEKSEIKKLDQVATQ